MDIRSLAQSIMMFRSKFANVAGLSFGGKRDMYQSCGYPREIAIAEARSMFERNEVANRVVKARPKATWRGGFELIEDQNPKVDTEFEKQWEEMEHRLKVTDVFKRADVLAGIARYAVIVICAPGEVDQPLVSCKAEEITQLLPFAEEDALIDEYDVDPLSVRFGRAKYYQIKRNTVATARATNALALSKRVHWTRTIHVADGLLDDNIYGEPRLKCIWNRLMDLEKVTGGGSEAFWKRADPGMQFDLDPTIDLDLTTPEGIAQQTDLNTKIEEYEHGLRRILFTRGVKANVLNAGVSDIGPTVLSLMSLVSVGTGIPQRVLAGSEQGKLAAKQDRVSWDNEIIDRQNDWAEPHVVEPFIDMMIKLGALPEPKQYEVRWSTIRSMDDEQRAAVATSWAGLNNTAAGVIVSADEIRERVLEMEPRKEAGLEEAMVDTLTAAITAGNDDVIRHLLGIAQPAKHDTPERIALEVKPDTRIDVLQTSVEELKSLCRKDESPALLEKVAGLESLVRALISKETKVDISPVVNVPAPAVRKFRLAVNRDAKGLLKDGMIEEVE